jgi:hypothetical protein
MTWMYTCPINIATLLMLCQCISRHCGYASAHSLQCFPGGSLCAITISFAICHLPFAICHLPLPSARHLSFAVRHCPQLSLPCLRLAICHLPFAVPCSPLPSAFPTLPLPFTIHLHCLLFAVHCLLFPFTYAVSSLQPVSLILPSQWLPSPVWFSLALGCSRLPPCHAALFEWSVVVALGKW